MLYKINIEAVEQKDANNEKWTDLFNVWHVKQLSKDVDTGRGSRL